MAGTVRGVMGWGLQEVAAWDQAKGPRLKGGQGQGRDTGKETGRWRREEDTGGEEMFWFRCRRYGCALGRAPNTC